MSHTQSNGASRILSRRRRKVLRPSIEALEERLMLDAADDSFLPALVVGRVLSAYNAGAVQGNQVAITYTVYNEQADPETGVLLTTALAPGVMLVDASAAPDRSGSELSWSLGTVAGFGRASVTVTLALAGPGTLQLDLGAHAFATVAARAVTDAAPAATLRPGSVDPALLAATTEANTDDPIVQEAAGPARLRPAADLRLPPR